MKPATIFIDFYKFFQKEYQSFVTFSKRIGIDRKTLTNVNCNYYKLHSFLEIKCHLSLDYSIFRWLIFRWPNYHCLYFSFLVTKNSSIRLQMALLHGCSFNFQDFLNEGTSYFFFSECSVIACCCNLYKNVEIFFLEKSVTINGWQIFFVFSHFYTPSNIFIYIIYRYISN